MPCNRCRYIASQNGHHACVKLLIDRGANVNTAATDDGTTSLFKACQNEHLEVARTLLESGAHVNKSTLDDGFQPLHAAAQSGNLDMVSLLVEFRADVNVKSSDDREWTTLLMAAFHGHHDVIRYLIAQGVDIDAQTAGPSGFSPVFVAAQNGHTAAVLELARHGADLDLATQDTKTTPLHAAACASNFDVAKLLASLAADTTLVDSWEQTAADVAHLWNADAEAAWLAEIAGWPALEIAVGCRLPEAVHATLARHMRDDPLPAGASPRRHPEEPEAGRLLALAKSTRPFQSLGEVAVCMETVALVRLLSNGWSLQANHLYHRRAQACVGSVLHVAERQRRLWASCIEGQDSDAALWLPPELWLYVLHFVLRGYWPQSATGASSSSPDVGSMHQARIEFPGEQLLADVVAEADQAPLELDGGGRWRPHGEPSGEGEAGV